jgi:hypothetical protein
MTTHSRRPARLFLQDLRDALVREKTFVYENFAKPAAISLLDAKAMRQILRSHGGPLPRKLSEARNFKLHMV